MFVVKFSCSKGICWFAARPIEESYDKVCDDGSTIKLKRHYFTITKDINKAYRCVNKADAFDFIGRYIKNGFIDGPYEIKELKI